MNKTAYNIIISILLLALSPTLVANSIKTWRENDSWVTEAVVDATGWRDTAIKAITDLGSYHNWALDGMDGNDAVSATYWEQFTDFRFEPPAGMILVYDMNLGWPLGSTGNTIAFTVDKKDRNSEAIHLINRDKPIGIEEIHLRISPKNAGTGTGDLIQIQLSMRFSWLLDILIDAKSYAAHMNEVLTTLSVNLKTYCETLTNRQ